jgi:uncharacterized protein involved in exopolysaccharide biosynthesis
VNNLPPAPPSNPDHLPVSGGTFPLVESPGILSQGFESQESPLRQYWRIFYKRRLIIAAITAFCIALGILVAMLTQREYAATVTVQVARDTANVLNIEGVDQAPNTFDQEFYETQYQLLKSRSLAEAVVRDLKLADNYAFLSDFNAGDEDDFKTMDRAKRFSVATGIVNGNTVVEPVANSSIINVRFNSPNPVMAATIANSLAENYVESNLSRRFEARPTPASSCRTALIRYAPSSRSRSASRSSTRRPKA